MREVGEAGAALFRTGFVLLVIFVPLGLWKLVEIVWWIINHVRVSITW